MNEACITIMLICCGVLAVCGAWMLWHWHDREEPELMIDAEIHKTIHRIVIGRQEWGEHVGQLEQHLAKLLAQKRDDIAEEIEQNKKEME